MEVEARDADGHPSHRINGRTATANTCAGWLAGPSVPPTGERSAQNALESDFPSTTSVSLSAWRRYSADSSGPDSAVVTSVHQQGQHRDRRWCGGAISEFGQPLLVLADPCRCIGARRFDDACGPAFEERPLPAASGPRLF